jgi:hypothetical protein
MWTVWRKERALPVPRIELRFVCRPARSLVSTTTATGCDVSVVILSFLFSVSFYFISDLFSAPSLMMMMMMMMKF